MIRIVVDTNLWLSFLISRSFTQLDRLLRSGAVLLVSTELLAEFQEVATRPKFRKYFPPADFEVLTRLITELAELVTVVSRVSVCRDKDDDYLLALARDGRADYLLTVDKDLLTLGNFEGTRICTLTDFLDEHTAA